MILLRTGSASCKRTSCFLDAPSERYRESFLRGAAEFLTENRLDSTYAEFLGYDLKRLESHFGAFVVALRGLADGSVDGLSDNSGAHQSAYPDRVLWLIDGADYIGQLSIRPELATPYLLTYGGHIGYSVRPSRRRRGYGYRILSLARRESRGMGLSKLLVTCDSDNIASKKIIESNGGEFESAMKMDSKTMRAERRKRGETVDKLRYWIALHE